MLFAILGIVLGLAGGAGGYWYWSSHRAVDQDAEAPKAEAEPEPPGIIPMDPFVVNLADEGGGRFLRVTLSLAVNGEERAKETTENKVVSARIRSAILERLTQQTSDMLVTPEGKAALKKAIAEQASRVDHELKVTDVLFSEFVVQF